MMPSQTTASLDHHYIWVLVSAFVMSVCVCSWSHPVLAMPPTPVSAEGSTIDPEPGEFYRSRTRIDLADGASFLIPSDWQGVLPPGARTFYLESPKHPGVGLVAVIQDATPEELEDHLNEPQVIDEGYVLHPIGSARRTSQRITAVYQSGDNVGRAIAIFGSQKGVLYLFTGPKEQSDYYDRLLEEMVASTQFRQAGPEQNENRKGIQSSERCNRKNAFRRPEWRRF